MDSMTISVTGTAISSLTEIIAARSTTLESLSSQLQNLNNTGQINQAELLRIQQDQNTYRVINASSHYQFRKQNYVAADAAATAALATLNAAQVERNIAINTLSADKTLLATHTARLAKDTKSLATAKTALTKAKAALALRPTSATLKANVAKAVTVVNAAQAKVNADRKLIAADKFRIAADTANLATLQAKVDAADAAYQPLAAAREAALAAAAKAWSDLNTLRVSIGLLALDPADSVSQDIASRAEWDALPEGTKQALIGAWTR